MTRPTSLTTTKAITSVKGYFVQKLRCTFLVRALQSIPLLQMTITVRSTLSQVLPGRKSAQIEVSGGTCDRQAMELRTRAVSAVAILRQPSRRAADYSTTLDVLPVLLRKRHARVASPTSSRRLQKYIAIRTETTSSAAPNSPATYLVLLLATVSGSKNS